MLLQRDVVKELNTIATEMVNHAYRNLSSCDNITVMILLLLPPAPVPSSPAPTAVSEEEEIAHAFTSEVLRFGKHSEPKESLKEWVDSIASDQQGLQAAVREFVREEYQSLYTEILSGTPRSFDNSNTHNTREYLSAAIYGQNSDQYNASLSLRRGDTTDVANAVPSVFSAREARGAAHLSPMRMVHEIDRILSEETKRADNGGREPLHTASSTTAVSSRATKVDGLEDDDLEFLLNDANF